MIGYFGSIVFQSSSKKLLTFNDFKYAAAGRWEKHNVIGKKPVSEFIGPDTDSITFTIILNGSYGVKPRTEMETWIEMVNSGEVDILVVGNKPLGKDKWSVKSVSEAWDVIFNKGELFSGKIDVTLEEYITTIEETSSTQSSVDAQASNQTSLIKQVQHDLQRVSCLATGESNATGEIDDKTKAAIKQFRYIVDLPDSDAIDCQLTDALNSIVNKYTMGYGWPENTTATKFIQWWIGASKSGVFDDITIQKVKEWQLKNKIWGDPDGVIREVDWNQILR